jgi:DNA-binding CsgD family transcriptional regulator
MAEGYHALTEKEKAALRLLLGGHDAKSMASHLGLSVHTVNERLREARRKLSVSSSKAAARILREAESPTPQLLGDRFSGDAGPVPSGQTLDSGPMRSQHEAAWTIGGFAMIALMTTALVAALAFASTEPAASPLQATASQVAESDASRAARDWLTLVDARKWPESWAATGVAFRSVNSVANWQAAAEQVHARLGPALSRELLSDQDTPAPPNGYRAIRFRTNFANTQGATEVLSLAREGDRWRVVGIYVE